MVQAGGTGRRRRKYGSVTNAVWKRPCRRALVADGRGRTWEIVEEGAKSRRHNGRTREGPLFRATASAGSHGCWTSTIQNAGMDDGVQTLKAKLRLCRWPVSSGAQGLWTRVTKRKACSERNRNVEDEERTIWLSAVLTREERLGFQQERSTVPSRMPTYVKCTGIYVLDKRRF